MNNGFTKLSGLEYTKSIIIMINNCDKTSIILFFCICGLLFICLIANFLKI